jgi:hypothetical protein
VSRPSVNGDCSTEYGEEELMIAFLLGRTTEECAAFLSPAGWGQDCRGWRAAQIASWDVPVACCIRCRRNEYGGAGLTYCHTTHRGCWPEAFDSPFGVEEGHT